MSMFEDVKKFHETYGQPVGKFPHALDQDRIELRVGLIREEFEDELIPSLLSNDAVETYDAAIDILYVTMGLLVEMGMDPKPGFDEVQSSNMSKLGADGKPILSRGMEEDGFPAGKVLKGPGYFRPDLSAVLMKMGLGLDVHESHVLKPHKTSDSKGFICGNCLKATSHILRKELEEPCKPYTGVLGVTKPYRPAEAA
jgi:hypothetical protein